MSSDDRFAEISAAVLDFVDEAEAPSHVHAIGLRGLAWKEHANACEVVGDLRRALASAERAVEIYDESSALIFDQTRARLVVCKVLREMGETERAMALARECAAVFTDFGDLPFVNMARMFEAGVLFASKRFKEAFAIFTDVMGEAELEGDRLTVARCLHCAAQCAREMGEPRDRLAASAARAGVKGPGLFRSLSLFTTLVVHFGVTDHHRDQDTDDNHSADHPERHGGSSQWADSTCARHNDAIEPGQPLRGEDQKIELSPDDLTQGGGFPSACSSYVAVGAARRFTS